MILNKNGKYQYPEPKIFYISHQSTISQLRLKILKILKESRIISGFIKLDETRLLKLNPNFSFESIE